MGDRMSADSESFLARWSRRKLAAEREAERPAESLPPDTAADRSTKDGSQGVAAVEPVPAEALIFPDKRKQARIPFGALLEAGLIQPGQVLTFVKDPAVQATVLANGHIHCNGQVGSIHAIARLLLGGIPANGWELWFYNSNQTIDELRKQYRKLKEQS